ncbi:Rpn family recombination-promoting nuclease/putative transposase [Sporosarcina siberiensis]|uniref:Rpn family recombination-promoting nuclease/putative transposase n=1 Tax=Sporosarcina siberiensis TaxID=1365606 RepID=A0ABW4SH11_9BACL
MVLAFVREENEQYGFIEVDQDGLWKKVIGELFEDFILFFAPKLHTQVDFSIAPEFLDKELFQEVTDRKKGRRFADQLAKVRLKNGEEKWILVHIEVQSTNETEFPERMFQYFYRIYDRYQEKIIAIAVHTSPAKSNALEHFEYDYFGTTLHYSYTNYRTEDYPDEELERSDKLFSKIVLAAKGLHQTKDKEHQRYLFKSKLMRAIVRNKDYSRTAVQAVFHFIDYLLQLSEEYTKQLSEEIRPMIREETELMELYNKENAPPTIMNAFDLEFEKGLEKGVEKGLERGLEQGLEKGKIVGKMIERHAIAQKLILEKLPLEMVSTATGLTLEEVKEIQEKLN